MTGFAVAKTLICAPRGLLLALTAIAMSAAAAAAAAKAEGGGPTTVLEGQIIRSLAVHPDDPNRILVGIKGKPRGSALVHESRDGGRNWTALNGGQPVHPHATDVQTVAYGPDGLILAGTWKFGLYMSGDGGASFVGRPDFRSPDIRDIKSAPDDPDRMYAATGRGGIFGSTDGGRTWRPLGPGRDFFWSVSVTGKGDVVYAVSLEKAVYRSRNGGRRWVKVFTEADAYSLAAAPRDPSRLALATKTGLYVSEDQGDTWTKPDGLPADDLSSVRWSTKMPDTLYLGSWDNGAYAYDLGADGRTPLLPDKPVAHLEITGDTLLAATWGQGLSLIEPGGRSPD